MAGVVGQYSRQSVERPGLAMHGELDPAFIRQLAGGSDGGVGLGLGMGQVLGQDGLGHVMHRSPAQIGLGDQAQGGEMGIELIRKLDCCLQAGPALGLWSK